MYVPNMKFLRRVQKHLKFRNTEFYLFLLQFSFKYDCKNHMVYFPALNRTSEQNIGVMCKV